MGMIEAYKTCIRKYVVFEGRARRSEYWYFVLCNTIIRLILGAYGTTVLFSYDSYYAVMASPVSAIAGLYVLFIFLPDLAVTVRRLHDTGRSGAYILISLIPLVGPILLLVRLCTDSDMCTNRYGESPKYSSDPIFYGERNYYHSDERSDENQAPVPVYLADTAGLTVPSEAVVVTCISGPIAGQAAEGKAVYIGRDPNLCQLVFPQDTKGVSRVHCMVVAKDGGIEVRDMKSTYGTYRIDGTRFQPDIAVRVSSGTTFYLGYEKNIVSVSLRR